MKDKLFLEATGNFPFQFYIEKALPTEEGEKLFVEGIASTMNIDHDNERMSESALQSMCEVINEKSVPLRLEHQKGDDAIIGNVFKAWMDARKQLWIKAELDGANTVASLLHKSLKDGTTKLGLSVGGRVKKAVREISEAAGKAIQTFYEVALDEVSVTRKPANYDAWLFAKSITEQGENTDRFYFSPLHNEFLLENPQLDYLASFAKSIPSQAWQKVESNSIEKDMKKEEKEETKEKTEETEETKEKAEETSEETEKTTDEETEKSYVSKKEFKALEKSVVDGFSMLAALLKSETEETKEKTEEEETEKTDDEEETKEKTREGQEDEGGNGDTEPTREEKAEETEENTEEKSEETAEDEYEMPESMKGVMKNIVKAFEGVGHKNVRKSKMSPVQAFSEILSLAFQDMAGRFEKSGRRVVGLEKLFVDMIRNNDEIQKSIKELQDEPGFKKSVQFNVPYIVNRDGKRFALTASEVGGDVQKSAKEGVSFKELYKSEYSSSAQQK